MNNETPKFIRAVLGNESDYKLLKDDCKTNYIYLIYSELRQPTTNRIVKLCINILKFLY